MAACTAKSVNDRVQRLDARVRSQCVTAQHVTQGQEATCHVFPDPWCAHCFPHATIMPTDVWFLLITHDERPLGNVLCVAVEDGANVHSFLEKVLVQCSTSLPGVDALHLEVYHCKDTHYKLTNRDKNTVAQHIKEVLSNESKYDYLATRETLPDMKEGEILLVRLPGKIFLLLSHFKWD